MAQVERIAIPIEPFDWPFARDEAGRIDAHWARLREEKPNLFDGAVLMARDLSVQGSGYGSHHASDRGPHERAVLGGSAFVTGYKPFLCWREFGWPGEGVYNLFAMPALRAADGAFMLGRMSATTANTGKLYFPAGTPEPDDAGPDGFVDFDANILRELAEETGLRAADVACDGHWTIVFAGPLVACMKVVRSPLPADALVARVAAYVGSQAEPELDGLVPIRSPRDLDMAGVPAFMKTYLAWALTQA